MLKGESCLVKVINEEMRKISKLLDNLKADMYP